MADAILMEAAPVLVPETTSPLSRVDVSLPLGRRIEDVLVARPLLPFSPPVLSFMEDLGRALRSDPAVRRHPELVTLGFWARAANIRKLRDRFLGAYPEAQRLPRGVAFHIAPSNVDTIFVYSLLLSMLAGNVNIVRVSSRGGEQTNLLMQVFARVLADAAEEVRAATAIVRYAHDRAITDDLSAACAIRIVWGGDATVGLVRESPLAPAGTELVFPNKFSLAVIDAQAWLATPDPAMLARKFVNDSLWFGQAACSSPRSIVWRGSEADTVLAADRFWAAIEAAADDAGFDWEDAHAVAKLLAEQGAAIDDHVSIRATHNNRVRVIGGRTDLLGRPSGASNGFFREARVDDLTQLATLAQPHWQTIVSYGISSADWRQAASTSLPAGIDRIVPPGTALDFDAIWDGKDLLTAMTRMIVIAM